MNAGPGRPSGGGGGRRRRRGRRPHNQRGQKPGPGLSRENKDGIYTAPMDHSYRAAMAGGNNNGHRSGGRQRPGFATQYPQPEPEPLPMNGDATSRIFAFIEDLFFMAKIQETARKLNVKVEFVKTDKDLMERMEQNGEEKPSLIIFDLKQKAHEVGCDMVLPRSAFSQNLPQLLRRHGAPEDAEPTVQ